MTKRFLTTEEIQLAQTIFGNTINYSVVQIDSEAAFLQPDDVLYTPNSTIYYGSDTQEYYSENFGTSTDWISKGLFIHELTHVWQFQIMHGEYLPTVTQQMTEGSFPLKHGNYDYDDVFNGTPFYKLTLEAQAEFLQDYFLLKNSQTIDNTGPYGEILNNTGRTQQDFNSIIESQVKGLIPFDPKDPDYVPASHKFMNGGQTRVPDNQEISEVANLVKNLVNGAKSFFSPLVLDLDGDNIETASLTSSNAVFFDHNHDGYSEASGWVTGGDGLLAIDLNADGVINGGNELFGDQTGERNGFEVLAQYDSNVDGKITGEDVFWSDLRIWVDANGDGFSQADELKALDSLSITQISLAYSNVNTTDHGNSILENGSFVIGGNTRTVSDVYFAVDKTNSVYTLDYELDKSTPFMPVVRGYGTLPDLHIAMSLDNTGTGNLLDKVAAFKALSLANLFSADGTSLDAVKAILFRWAEVEGVVSGSRGSFVDAKELAFLEALTGEPFLQRGIYSNPATDAGDQLSQAFDTALNGFFARLAIQGAGKDLFTGDVHYNMATDTFDGITGLNSTTLASLETEAAGLASTALRQAFWSDVVRVIEYGMTVTSTETTALNTAIHDSDSSLTLSGIEALLVQETATTTYNGTSGNDSLSGSSGHDLLYASGGNDTIYGLGDNDSLYGDFGDDTLIGGTGGDYLSGDFGSDTYIYNVGDGFDVIDDYNGGAADKISFGTGITAANITLTRAGDNDLVIDIGGSTPGQIILKDQFQTRGAIETLEFTTGSPITLANVSHTVYGTSNADTLVGVEQGGSINDTIYGGAGNDNISGGSGDDTIYGDAGKDIISGGGGNDTIHGGSENDIIDGGNGNNILYGDAGDDVITSSSGNDAYYFTSGNDVYTDTGGTDTIYLPSGFTTGGTVYYKIGDDLKVVFSDTDSILIKGQFSSTVIENINFNGTAVALSSVTYITQGDDSANTLNGSGGADNLYGMGGNDTLYGNNGADHLYGGTGNDTLDGGNDNDFLDGGAGDDIVKGGYGDDTYYYVSGNDSYEETNGTDTVQFAAGWTLANLDFRRDIAVPDHLLIYINGSNSVLLKYEFSAPTYTFETLKFADNSTLNLNTYEYTTYGTASGETISGIAYNASPNDTIHAGGGNDTLYGNGGNDTLYGEDGNDTLDGGNDNDTMDGGAGNDSLKGNYGDDIYYISAGNDTFEEYTGNDTIILGPSWTTSDVTLIRNVGTLDDLTIKIGSSDTTLLKYHFYSSYTYAFETLKFSSDNTTWTLSNAEITTLGTAAAETIYGISTGASLNDTIYAQDGNDTVYGGSGNDHIYGGNGNDTINGENDNDYIDGGVGNDTLNGGSGNDVYVYSSGLDTVTDTGGTDTLKITGATINDLTYSVSGNNVTLIIHSGTDQVQVNDLANASTSGHIETIQFDDGFQTTLEDYAAWTFGTSGANTIAGTSGHDTIAGLAGNDTLNGAGGNDNIHGGTGNDTITGGSGDDLLHGGDGNDLIYGQDGLDTLYGGTGNDTFVFEAASAFNNIDVIKDFSSASDAIHIGDLLTGYSPTTSDIGDFVSLSTSSGNTTLMVDRDGSGSTYTSQAVVSLSGVTGLDVHDLLNSGHLIAA